jgi:tol-pal system protein YbgF
LTTALSKKLSALAVALVLSTGCVSTKMMEFTYQELDTVKTTQQELLGKVDALTSQLEEERDARVRSEAEQASMMEELRNLLDMLAYRFEDTSQLLANRNTRGTHETPPSDRMNSVAPDTSMSGAPDSLTAVAPTDSDSEPDKLFKSSYMDLTLGNYDLAIQGFKNYLVRYPNATNIQAAHYYLGDAYYKKSRYLEAVAEYQTVIKDYSRSRLTPAAYLKSGYCYQQLGEKQLGERTFRELISIYPRTEEAEQARVALQDLGG